MLCVCSVVNYVSGWCQVGHGNYCYNCEWDHVDCIKRRIIFPANPVYNVCPPFPRGGYRSKFFLINLNP